MEEIINDYEYPSLLADVKKTNYGYKEVIELWNAIDDESSTYEEYSQYDIARTIVYLINKIEELENKLMYALSPTTHELALTTQEQFKTIIRENLEKDTYTIKRALKEYWEDK